MTRDDFYWLALRVTGLYLLVLAIEAVPALLTALDGHFGQAGTPLTGPIFAVLAPAAGTVALFAYARRGNTTSASTVTISTSRDDLLWVCCKVFGLYCLSQGIALLTAFSGWSDAAIGGASFTVAGVLQLALGAWLFFGEQLWRWATARSRRVPSQL